MTCANCGKEPRPGDTYCRECGAGLTPPLPAVPSYYAGRPQKTSGWAVASLIFGSLAYMCLPIVGAVLAIIFGILGRKEAKRSEGRVGGQGISTAGIVLGAINLVFMVAILATFIPWVVIKLGETRTVTRKVNLRGAEEVVALLEIREGELVVTEESGTMFEGIFTYSIDSWEPDIDYSSRDEKGRLDVRQVGEDWSPTLWSHRNDWDITFGDEVPLEINARLHASDGSFKLSSPSFLALDIDSGSGEVYADLSGDMSSLKRVKVNQDSGNVTLDLKGKYTSYTRLDVENTSGDVVIDLLGTWESGLGAEILNSSGDVSLRLPQNVGVKVRAKVYSGDIEAPGLEQESEDEEGITYVNDAWGESIVTLYFDIEVHRGDVVLQVGD
jgi:hypothetical protein